MATERTTTLVEKMSLLDLMEQIVMLTKDSEEIKLTGRTKRYIDELVKRLDLTPMQALFLSVFMDQCDDNSIHHRDLARHFDCRTIAVLAKESHIDSLVNLHLIAKKCDRDGEVSYRVLNKTVEALKAGKLPEKDNYKSLSAKEWITAVDDLLHSLGNDEISDEYLKLIFEELIDNNLHLNMVQQIKNCKLKYTDLLLFLAMSMEFLNNHDDRIAKSDIRDYFSPSDLRKITLELEAGNHKLMQLRLVEHSCIDGEIESDKWCLTNYSKYELYEELNLIQPKNVRSNLTHYEDIAPKELFYNPEITKKVERLKNLLESDNMSRIQNRLKDKGMRTGFTCIFYGGPGTGKTETALQLARATKRDIMLVDIPSIRSKWVGEQEKNIKNLFERYRRAVKSATDGNAPILLFNEADALLNKRNENSISCADKEENSMQNIILQEMENLEGFMIATSNLPGSLDDAFERRFLYKINFTKPTPYERKHIWMSMLPDLTQSQALLLASKFDFSGGQIENITRKRIISDILEDREELDMDCIIENCNSELLTGNPKSRKMIGF